MKAWIAEIKNKCETIFHKLIHVRYFRILFNTGKSFYTDDCLTLSASISFYFLLSFIPFLIILGSLMGYCIEYIQYIYNVTPADMSVTTTKYIKMVVPYLEDDFISQFFTISKYKVKLGTIGGISLLVSAALLFSTLHDSFFRIFGGKYINFILSRLMGLLFILTLIIFLFFIQYFFTLILGIIAAVESNFPALSIFVDLFRNNGFVISFLITTLLIIALFSILIFYFTKDVLHSTTGTISGALLFSFLWSGAKYIYNIYITEISNFSIIYGSLTWLVTMILWIYYSTLILLLSMEFIKSINMEKFKEKGLMKGK